MKLGIFTAAGAVLCFNCHGSSNIKPEWYARRDEDLAAPLDDHDASVCARCEVAISVRADVAHLHNFARAVNAQLRTAGAEASVWQTGGMCCNVGIKIHGWSGVLVAGDGEAVGAISLYRWRDENGYDNGDEQDDFVEAPSLDRAVAAVARYMRIASHPRTCDCEICRPELHVHA